MLRSEPSRGAITLIHIHTEVYTPQLSQLFISHATWTESGGSYKDEMSRLSARLRDHPENNHDTRPYSLMQSFCLLDDHLNMDECTLLE